jgi:hypothetical protein
MKKCIYCHQRFRYELQHNKTCRKRRAVLNRPAVQETKTIEVTLNPYVQEDAIKEIDSLPAIQEFTPVKIKQVRKIKSKVNP